MGQGQFPQCLYAAETGMYHSSDIVWVWTQVQCTTSPPNLHTIMQKRLSALAQMHIHYDVPGDMGNTVSLFADMFTRRLQLQCSPVIFIYRMVSVHTQSRVPPCTAFTDYFFFYISIWYFTCKWFTNGTNILGNCIWYIFFTSNNFNDLSFGSDLYFYHLTEGVHSYSTP